MNRWRKIKWFTFFAVFFTMTLICFIFYPRVVWKYEYCEKHYCVNPLYGLPYSSEKSLSLNGRNRYWHFNQIDYCRIKELNYSIDGTTTYVTLSNDKGQLGDHLFQIASLFGVAKMNGFVPVLPKTYAVLHYYDLHNSDSCGISLRNVEIYYEIKGHTIETRVSKLPKTKQWALNGFFQTWNYFDAKLNLNKVFNLKTEYKALFIIYWKSIQRQSVKNVCIHVRRGEVTRKYVKQDGFTSAPLSYFNRSMSYFYERLKHVQFIITSNDIAWCRKSFDGRGDIHFSPFKDSFLNLEIIRSCDHVILTSGSLGWWGGWLSGGSVIYYKGYPEPGSSLDKQFNRANYFPDHWISMN